MVLINGEDVIKPAWTEAMRRSSPQFDPDSAVLVVVTVMVGIVVWDVADSLVKHLRVRPGGVESDRPCELRHGLSRPGPHGPAWGG